MSKVAAIQMCSTHLVDENLATAKFLIREAANNGANLAVLPENFALMSLDVKEKLNQKETLGDGKIQNFLSQTAKENKIWLVGGTIPIASTEHANKIFASCLVYDDNGKLVAHYEKSNLFDAIISETEIHKESAFIQAGKNVVVVNTPMGTLGLAVCFDVRFPILFKELFKKGAEIIAIPAAFTVKTGEAHWELLIRARAIDTFSYVIAAAQGGTHTNGRKTYGHSLIVDPWGTIIAKRQEMLPGIIYAHIDLEHLNQIRKSIPL